jgi:hypothetical protein
MAPTPTKTARLVPEQETYPVPRAGDSKSIAAQYARAKALREREERGKGKWKGKGGEVVKSEGEERNIRKQRAFGRTWMAGWGFWAWLL